ncbi:MAG: DUF975 family protein [Bacillota bacterium]|nr:DUF975 family protein [Bacillota bacterium]
MDRTKLKNMARQQIKGNIGALFLISLIITVISQGIVIAFSRSGYNSMLGIYSIIPDASFFLRPMFKNIGTIVSTVVSSAFALSVAMIYLNLAKGVKPGVKNAFDGFHDWWSAIKVVFFEQLFTLLWALLFIIPGIVKGLSYSMSIYILAENKGMPALTAIERSKKMMAGHKMELFVLGLSFIGWILLGCITLGIGFIWIIPYISATYTNFYYEVKGEPISEVNAYEPQIKVDETFFDTDK